MIDQPPSAPQRGTGQAFVQHWDWVAEKGLMPRSTALGIRAAVSQILKIEEGWEALDVGAIDPEAFLVRFRNLSDLSPGSLATYESRFRTGLESYRQYLDNPTTYQPRARKTTQREVGRQFKAKSPGKEGARQAATIPAHPNPDTAVPGSAPGARLVVYPFPVRPEIFAELKLPADLTVDEATRLSAFLKAIALSDDADRG